MLSFLPLSLPPPPQLLSPLHRPSCSPSLLTPAVRVLAPEQTNGNIPPPSPRETGASAKTRLRDSRTPPRPRYRSSRTWALAPPLEKVSPPISSLWGPAARLTSARGAEPEAEAALWPATTRAGCLAPPTSLPEAAAPRTLPSRPCCRSTAAVRSWCAPWITATAPECPRCRATAATPRTRAPAPFPGSAPKTTPPLPAWPRGGRPCRAWP